MDTSVSDNNLGVWHHRIFILHVATMITDVLFKQVLIRTAVETKNRNGYFTLRYNRGTGGAIITL